MNKQEAINELMSKSREIIFGDDENVYLMYLSRKRTIELISQIYEPQKVVVPKFVAEWIEYCKRDKFYALHDAYANMDEEMKYWRFIGNNSALFAKAWIDGYEVEEVEKEELYTVEIPDPNSYYNYRFLSRNGNGVCIDASNHNGWKSRRENQLTEAEIKKDFEWAFQFAKPVEEK